MKCCEQALEDGWSWVWVDTCCIDKRSSSELSEAINSMFAWYANAQICYACLDDIDLFDPFRLGSQYFARGNPARSFSQGMQTISEKDLSKARWFTRGWTLQELIAPRNVVFYVKGWLKIGDKVGMKDMLARIAGIDEAALVHKEYVRLVHVAERMSWAARRNTTRVEDMAYCLMGIFDVNMPLLYGEGVKAFGRLQEEIMKDSDDQSLFAWMPVGKGVGDVEELVHPLTGAVARGGKALGVFARHPSEFLEHRGIMRTGPWGAPHTMTNKGLKMERMAVLRLDDELFLVILGCGFDQESLGIVVRNLVGGTENQNARLDDVGLIKTSLVMRR